MTRRTQERRVGPAPGSDALYHTIEFAVEFVADLELSPKQRLEQLLIRQGTRLRVQLKPSVVETVGGPVEVADLLFEDGTATRTVPFAYFAFVE
jgi:hypothetical protein